jgi:hypothetical protein
MNILTHSTQLLTIMSQVHAPPIFKTAPQTQITLLSFLLLLGHSSGRFPKGLQAQHSWFPPPHPMTLQCAHTLCVCVCVCVCLQHNHLNKLTKNVFAAGYTVVNQRRKV